MAVIGMVEAVKTLAPVQIPVGHLVLVVLSQIGLQYFLQSEFSVISYSGNLQTSQGL